MGNKFLSQTYHLICVDTFEFQALCLDLIPVTTSTFHEVIGSLLVQRQEYWTATMKPEPIAAGAIADRGANVQAAGRAIFREDEDEDYPEDMLSCQNHGLKGCCEDIENRCKGFCLDMVALAELFRAVQKSGPALMLLRAHQYIHEVVSVALVVQNDTRWEGRVLMLESAIRQEQSLPSLQDFARQVTACEKVSDFLDPSFFRRLKIYKEELERLNSASLLFQNKHFPTGHLVILAYECILEELKEGLGELSQVQRELRDAISESIRERLYLPAISSGTVFLKAALFHPYLVPRFYTSVGEEVMMEAINGVKADISALSGEGTLQTEFACVAFDRFLEQAKKHNTPKVGLKELFTMGQIGGVSAIEYWRSVIASAEDPNGLKLLIPVAAMLLAAPSGESRDEFVFSVAGRVLSKERSNMSPLHLEMVTVIVMFIRNFGWSQKDAEKWVGNLLVEAKKLEEASED